MIKHWPYGLLALFAITSGWIYFSDINQNSVLEKGQVKSFIFDSLLSINQVESKNGNLPTSAKRFDGINDIIVDHTSKLELSRDFSISFWMYAEKKDVQQILLLKGENCPDGNPNFQGIEFEVVLTNDNLISFWVFATNKGQASEFLKLSTIDPIATNNWNFITVTFNFTEKKFVYFLNAKQATFRQENSIPYEDFEWHQSASSLKLGGGENWCDYVHGFSDFFQGYMGDVHIFDRQLNEEEIIALAGSPRGNLVKYGVASIVFLLIALAIKFYKRYRLILFKILKNEMFVKGSFSLIAIPIYFIVFSFQLDFQNTAYFGGDTWEYQSMAANLAMGHGIQRFGGLEDFEKYKFDRFDAEMVTGFTERAGLFNHYRTPLYPLMLGGLYAIAGINPAIAKKIQLLLLVIIASLIPWIGFHYWGTRGFISGTIAGFMYILKYHERALSILTEPLFAFLILLIVIFAILYEKHKTVLTAVTLGISMGLALLTKGNLLFVPIIFLVYLVISYIKKKDNRILKNGVIFLAAFLFTLMPWSLYASIKSKGLIVLSTQTENVLLDCNNEKSIDGNWHPEWKNSDEGNFFYLQDNLKGRSAVLRVINFYFHNPSTLLPSLINKIHRGFSPFVFLFIAVLFVFYNVVRQRILKYGDSRWLSAIVNKMVLIGILIFLASYFELLALPPLSPYLSVLTLSGFLLFVFLNKVTFPIPFIFITLLLNFFLMTMISFGEPRYIEVIDFIFLLCGTQCIILLIDGLKETLKIDSAINW